MALLDYLFPMQQIDTVGGLLGEDEARKIRQQSQIAGLLNFGANLLAQSGPSSQQRSFGQMLAPSLLAGYQAAQGTTESQLQRAAAAQKMRQEQDVRNLMSQAFVPQYTERPATQTAIPSDVGPAVVETPATREITGYNLDISRIAPQLAMRGRTDLIKNLAETQKLMEGKGELTGEYANIALGLYGTADVRKLPADAFQNITREMERQGVARSPKLAVNTSDPTAVARAGMEVTKQFTDLTKDSRERAARWNSVVSASKDPMNPATDATLIYSTAKILDPTGAVQQGDLKTIVGNPNIPQSIKLLAQKIDRGGSLTQEQREDLISNAYGIIKADQKNIEPIVGNFKDFANTFKVDPAKIESPYKDLQKPNKLMVPFGGKRVAANLAKDGNYYVKVGDKYYKVEE